MENEQPSICGKLAGFGAKCLDHVISEIAQDYISIRSLQQQIKLLKETIGIDEQAR